MRSSSTSLRGNVDKGALFFIGGLFYLGWFGAIYFAKWGYPMASLIFPLVLIGFQIRKRFLTKRKVFCALAVFFVGIGFDSVMFYLGFIQSPEAFGFSPAWLAAIWLLFAFSMMSLGASFSFPVWSLAALGAIFGPLSYKSGELFEVLIFTSSLTTWIYAVFWMFMFPIVVVASSRMS